MSRPRDEIRHAQNRSGEELVTRKQKTETTNIIVRSSSLYYATINPAHDLNQPLLPFNSVTPESSDRNLRSQIISALRTGPQDTGRYNAYFNLVAQEYDVWRFNSPDVATGNPLILRPPKKKYLRKIFESLYRRSR